MNFLVVGLNHRTAPIEVREKLSLTKAQLPQALNAMAGYGVPGVILSTCNRSEFYALEPESGGASPIQWGVGDARIKDFLVDYFGVSLLDLERYLYVYRNAECVRHLFRVAASLDSMIVGEDQIIGQVRESFDAAAQASTAQGPLAHLFQRALRVGRKVRHRTGIGHNALSVSRACVELAKSALGDLRQLRVMVVGTGDAGGLAAEVLSLSGVKNIMVTNRTYERALELARTLSGQAIPFQEMPRTLAQVDMVIGCTGSPGYVLEAGMVHEAMAARPERPLFLMDIAVPRDIDPAASQIRNVFLHDVDDLESISESRKAVKEQETRLAEELVAEEARQFTDWCLTLEALPTIITLRQQAERIRERELGKTLKKLGRKLSAEELESLEAMTRAIVKNLLHCPTVYLKKHPDSANIRIAREIFQLADPDLESDR